MPKTIYCSVLDQPCMADSFLNGIDKDCLSSAAIPYYIYKVSSLRMFPNSCTTYLIDQSLKVHCFCSRSATQSHRMPLGGIKAMRASALPMRNLAISVGTLDFKELPLRA